MRGSAKKGCIIVTQIPMSTLSFSVLINTGLQPGGKGRYYENANRFNGLPLKVNRSMKGVVKTTPQHPRPFG
jgi:hypothetical protein